MGSPLTRRGPHKIHHRSPVRVRGGKPLDSPTEWRGLSAGDVEHETQLHVERDLGKMCNLETLVHLFGCPDYDTLLESEIVVISHIPLSKPKCCEVGPRLVNAFTFGCGPGYP